MQRVPAANGAAQESRAGGSRRVLTTRKTGRGVFKLLFTDFAITVHSVVVGRMQMSCISPLWPDGQPVFISACSRP
jgi:hypothetical protein